MVSEDQARDLLARAGATIEVDEHAPMTLTGLPDGRARRGPALVAIAATVAVIAGVGYVAARTIGNGDGDAAPLETVEPVEQGVVLDQDQVPGLIGYTREEATELLEGRGLTVAVRPQPDGCNVPGIVTGSSPPVGTRVSAGDRVTIRVIEAEQVVDCVGEIDWSGIWGLVRFARGLEGPPELADRVTLQVSHDGAPGESDPSVALTRGEAADPANWVVCAGDGACHSALGALLELVTRAWERDGGGAESSPQPAARWSFDGAPCVDEQVTRQEREGWDHRFWVEVPTDGPWCPPTSVFIAYDNDDGRITAVGLDTVPTEGGNDITESELEASLDRIVAAQDFVAWARNEGPAPDFADRVRNFQPGFSPPWNTEPESRQTWSGCSGAGLGCLLNPVGAIARFRGDIEVDTGPSGCGATPDFGSAQDLVHVASRVNPACRGAVVVELWIDDDGRVYGVAQVSTAAY